VKKIYAADIYWEDTITLYPFATTILEGVRTVENNIVNSLRVTIEYQESANISKFEKYRVYGNGTEFVTIINGSVQLPNVCMHTTFYYYNNKE
jgi:hypothetical protein